jgi:hypothetical protein
MKDETENYRRARITELNTGLTPDEQARRTELEAVYGRVWDSDQIREQFEVIGFMAPFMVVKDKATGKKGSLEFVHSPRFYFNFIED